MTSSQEALRTHGQEAHGAGRHADMRPIDDHALHVAVQQLASLMRSAAVWSSHLPSLMSVLGRAAILQAIEQGAITITPFDPQRVGPASVDLTLANTFRVFRKVHQVIDVREHTDYRELTDKIDVAEGSHILIMPGETILGITQERLRLGPGLCGWLEGRSRFARLGLMVHISAPFMGPGIDSQQVLEMSNFGPAPLAVVPGTAICQFVFQQLEGSEQYEGLFAGQTQASF